MSGHGSPTRVGLIGYGSMGSAMARAISRSEELRACFSLCIYAKNKQQGGEQGMVFAGTLSELVSDSDIIIVAVRPEQVEGVAREVADLLPETGRPHRKLLISLAAGVTLDFLREQVEDKLAVVRVMPNTLVEVGKGLFGLCWGSDLSTERKDLVLKLFNGVGSVTEFDEDKMNAFTALAGCGPGMLFHVMDSFCEAGVSVGLTREASRPIAVALMAGCGILAESTGRHPVILREQSVSPAGMTIAGLNHMDRTGVRGHLIDAVKIALKQGEAMDGERKAG